jgi:hypothetical protein
MRRTDHLLQAFVDRVDDLFHFGGFCDFVCRRLDDVRQCSKLFGRDATGDCIEKCA